MNTCTLVLELPAVDAPWSCASLALLTATPLPTLEPDPLLRCRFVDLSEPLSYK